MRIPIGALKLMAAHLNLTHIVVFGYDGKSEHVATYGKTTEGCAQAAAFGNRMKDQLGWPESLHAEPSRVRALKARIEELEKQVANSIPAIDACKEFVRKVECGEARSKRSYAQMKEAIARAEVPA